MLFHNTSYLLHANNDALVLEQCPCSTVAPKGMLLLNALYFLQEWGQLRPHGILYFLLRVFSIRESFLSEPKTDSAWRGTDPSIVSTGFD